MIEVRQTDEFSGWFERLRDLRAKSQIVRRIERFEAGNPGDVEPVGEGVSELRIDFGPVTGFISRSTGFHGFCSCVAATKSRNDETLSAPKN